MSRCWSTAVEHIVGRYNSYNSNIIHEELRARGRRLRQDEARRVRAMKVTTVCTKVTR